MVSLEEIRERLERNQRRRGLRMPAAAEGGSSFARDEDAEVAGRLSPLVEQSDGAGSGDEGDAKTAPGDELEAAAAGDTCDTASDADAAGAWDIGRTPSFWMEGAADGSGGAGREDLDLEDVLVEAGRVCGMGGLHNSSAGGGASGNVKGKARLRGPRETSVESHFLNIQHLGGSRSWSGRAPVGTQRGVGHGHGDGDDEEQRRIIELMLNSVGPEVAERARRALARTLPHACTPARTPGMAKRARCKMRELGWMLYLERRHATDATYLRVRDTKTPTC